jgi:hypothetical protein
MGRSGDENWVDHISEHSAGGPGRLWAAIDARGGEGAVPQVIYDDPGPMLLNGRSHTRTP